MIAFGILQIILFFKIWGMTNNVKRIWKKIDSRPLECAFTPNNQHINI